MWFLCQMRRSMTDRDRMLTVFLWAERRMILNPSWLPPGEEVFNSRMSSASY